MHANTKLTPVLRIEVFKRWKEEGRSLRTLAELYHVDKRVIGRIIERGKLGDFSVHQSVNARYQKKPGKAKETRAATVPTRGVRKGKR